MQNSCISQVSKAGSGHVSQVQALADPSKTTELVIGQGQADFQHMSEVVNTMKTLSCDLTNLLPAGLLCQKIDLLHCLDGHTIYSKIVLLGG